MFDREILSDLPMSGYRLVPGTEGNLGLPVEAFLHLYAVDKAGNVKRIRTLVDVLELVEEVRSEEDAMRLLTLETSPETHFLFDDGNVLDVRVSSTPERPGELTERAAISGGYRPPSCVAVGDGFDLTRDLVRFDVDGRCDLFRRIEHISRAAKYSIIAETPIGTIDCSEVVLPEYE